MKLTLSTLVLVIRQYADGEQASDVSFLRLFVHKWTFIVQVNIHSFVS